MNNQFFIVECDDYHEITNIACSILTDKKAKYKSWEIGYASPNYYGVIYTGKRPLKAQVHRKLKKLVDETTFNIITGKEVEEDDDYFPAYYAGLL